MARLGTHRPPKATPGETSWLLACRPWVAETEKGPSYAVGSWFSVPGSEKEVPIFARNVCLRTSPKNNAWNESINLWGVFFGFLQTPVNA